jgi:hypothetical protein
MLPRRLARVFAREGHESITVQGAGLKGLTNGKLLNAAERQGFQALITTDQNIRYQTNLAGKKIAVLIICVFRNKLPYVLPHLPELLRALEWLKPGEIRYLGEPLLVRKHIQP